MLLFLHTLMQQTRSQTGRKFVSNFLRPLETTIVFLKNLSPHKVFTCENKGCWYVRPLRVGIYFPLTFESLSKGP